MSCMTNESLTTEQLLALAASGDATAWGVLLTGHEERLTRMVEFRMHPRLRSRIDAADVVQEAFVEATTHRDVYFQTAKSPLFLWLRGVVGNKLLELYRYHMGTRMRDANRERPFQLAHPLNDTTESLCEHLIGRLTSPSVAAVRDEIKTRLAQALNKMDPTDREVLVMRHFEQLTNAEAALVVGIQERAAAKRYLRALERLREILSELPGGLSELRP